MSDDRMTRVSVRVLDREYQVACPAEERSDMLDSAEYLDAKMREVRDTGKVVGLDLTTVATEQLRLVTPSPDEAIVIERVLPADPPTASVVARR